MDTNGMKTAVAKKGAAPTKEEQRARTLKAPSKVAEELLGKYVNQIRQALGEAMEPQRFTRLIINVIASNPDLLKAVNECPASLVGAILQCAQLGLEPNTPLGHGYLIPYFERDKVASRDAGHSVYKMRVSFQLGYQGVLLLAYRSGDVAYVDAEAVYEKDYFDHALGTDPFLKHVPYDGEDAGAVKKYYAVIKLKSGGSLFKVWSAAKVLGHAKKFSKSFNEERAAFFGPWADNFDAMAKKTVLLDTLKLAPKSSAFARQIASDNTTKSIPADASASIDMLSRGNEDFADGEALENKSAGALTIEQSVDAEPPIEESAPAEDLDSLKKGLGLKKGSEIPAPEFALA